MPTLTEADVLFEMFLPLLCAEHTKAMQKFTGEVLFEMVTQPQSRFWTLRGGESPWVRRGKTAKPDAHVVVAEALVQDVVRGVDVDMNAALADGRILASGSVEVFVKLGFSWGEARRLLDGMLPR